MKKFLYPLILAMCCLFLIFSVLSVTAEAPVTITILHTNDIHGRAETGEGMGLPKIAALVKQIKSENPRTLLLDAGDTIHGKTFTNLTKGESMIKLMNAMGYTAMTPGNHDFNYGYQRLITLDAQIADFPILCANIKKDGKFLFSPYLITEVGGKKIAIFGLATPETLYKSHPNNTKGLEFINPNTAAQDVINTVRGRADFIIALAHLGLETGSEFTSERLARKVSDIDLIVDGHSHTPLPAGKMVGSTLIVQTQEYTKYLGRVDLTFTGAGVEMKASLISAAEAAGIDDDREMISLITAEQANQRAILNAVIGKTPVRLVGERQLVRTGETNLGNLITDAMRALSGAEIALTNGGGIRASIEAGEITIENVLEVLPFGNTVVVKEMKGSDLLSCLEHGVSLYPEPSGAFPQVSGLFFTINPTKPAGERISAVQVNGKPLLPNGIYTVATNDFLAAGGDGYTWFAPAKNVGELGGLDEVLIEYIQSRGVIAPEVEGRIRVGDTPTETPGSKETVACF
ncbi:MAG TPA: 5'-nucleotidase C-terminal domain-containing protein [Bacillota bacterium]